MDLAEIETHLIKHDRDGIADLLHQRGISDAVRAGYAEALLPDLGATGGVLRAIRDAHVVHAGPSSDAQRRLLNEEMEIRARLLQDPRNGVLRQVLGWIFVSEHRIADGVSETREAVELQPNSTSAHFQLGLALLEQKSDQQAVAEIVAANRLRPDLLIFHRVLGEHFLQSGDLNGAEREFRHLASSSDSNSIWKLAEIHTRKGDLKSAIEDYRWILRLSANDAEAKRKLDETLRQSSSSGAGGAGANSRTVGQPYDSALLHPSTLGLRAPDTFYVEFLTTRGGFIMTVNRDWAPIGADRFYNLVKHHFYDDMTLYRVVPKFMVQFGISSYPPVSEAWEAATLKDEPRTKSNQHGYVSFAAAGPNTRTTQIFINLKDNPSLDGKGFVPFAVLGEEDMKVVETFYDRYGDAPARDQGQFAQQGKDYAAKTWPKLDRIIRATIIDISD